MHHFALLGGGIKVVDFAAQHLEGADLIVDAVFGTGFSRLPEGAARSAIEAINASGAPVLSVDTPSGVDGTSGEHRGVAVEASETIAIEAQKVGTASGLGSTLAGEVTVARIGIGLPNVRIHLAEESDVASVLPARDTDAHKGSAGSVAILAGSRGMGGAAVLACRGAARTGAGYVRLGSVSSEREMVAERLPEVLTFDLGDGWSAQAAERFGREIERSDVLALGPGFGTGDGAKAAILAALAMCSLPVVVDADGLNNLVDEAGALDRNPPTVITPHPAEMGRLLGLGTEEVQRDRVATARRAASELGCVVLLKGARSVIADPSGRVVINPSGSPALATAGSGDVLTGVIAALLASGLEAFEAGWAGAFLHGRAGELAGNLTPDGVVAWDVAEALPQARASLLRRPTNLAE
jgi:NAD(P)H-hydrate epimerase